MKTAKNTGVGFILVLLVCFTGSCAYTEKKADDPSENMKDGTFPALDAETERRIRIDLYNYYHPEALSVGYGYFNLYLGNHSGYEIIVIIPDMDRLERVTIAGYTFPFRTMLAWKQDKTTGDGSFYYVWEAYDLGLLTEDDIRSMHELYNKWRKSGGSRYKLREAYDLGLLTENDIRSMHELYNGWRE
jgi:hypothetical protein